MASTESRPAGLGPYRMGKKGMLSGRSVLTLGLGAIGGILLIGGLRLGLQPSVDPVHYHANWALWVNGDRVDLSGSRYMEDVASCAAESANITAPQRVHMHENNPDVVHVHHAGATWGHLLQNLGWGIGANWLYADRGTLFKERGEERLTFVLNGLVVPPAHNRVIQPGDRMLISFGSEDPDLLVEERFPSVAADAPGFDEGYDPAGCQGSAEETVGERIRRAFWF